MQKSRIVAYMVLSLYFLALLAVTYIAHVKDPKNLGLRLMLFMQAFVLRVLVLLSWVLLSSTAR